MFMKYILLFLFVLFIYPVFVEPNIITVKRIAIKDESLKGLKVVFATDFHFKPYDKLRLERTVKKINAEKPDIILLGGDYVNGHKKGATLSTDKIASGFARLKSKYGTIAVMGNHDGWQGKKDLIEAFEAVGITVLENSNKDFKSFSVAGVEDLQTGNPDINKALLGVKNPVILLSHSPDIAANIPHNVNLTLSGHTHGGQVVLGRPLIVPSKFGTKYAQGLFKPHDVLIYVSKGLGTSILPVRFNCFPEIVVINFV